MARVSLLLGKENRDEVRLRRAHPLAKIPFIELETRIGRARSMDFRKLSEDQVFERIRRIFDAYTTQTQTIRTNGLFRARVNPPDVVFENARDLWHPPSNVITRAGRFNLAGQPVFYASARAHAAVLEVRPAVGDTVTLLVAGAQQQHADISCAHVGLHRCDDFQEATGANGAHPRSNPRFIADLRSHGVLNKWLKIDDYFADLTTTVVPPGEDESVFKGTNAIARVLGKIPDIESLNYPSIATHLNCVNLCMTPEAADRHLRPCEAWMLRVTNWQVELPGQPTTRSGFYETEILARSRPIGQDWRIDWEKNKGELHPGMIGQLSWHTDKTSAAPGGSNGFWLPVELKAKH
jgi:hypothetical protein